MTAALTKRFPMMITPAEAEAIDAFRWEQKIASRSEAARQLIAKGLRAVAEESPEKQNGRTR